MSAPAPFTIDTSKFNAMCHDLAQLSARPHYRVLNYEVARVIEATVRNMPAAAVSKIRLRHELQEFTEQPASLYTPKSPRKGGGVFLKYNLRHRYPTELWNKIVARRKKSLIAALRSRGVAKKSFWDIARALGLEIKVPAFVPKALARTGKQYPENISTASRYTPTEAGIAFTNDQPNATRGGGHRALARAVRGRVRYFEQNLARSVFDSVDAIAKRYPGVLTAKR